MTWMESSSSSSLCDVTSFEDDSWTRFDCNGDEDPLDIMNELTDMLLPEDNDDFLQYLPQPTPIGCMGEVVQELSTRDDSHFNNSEIVNDVIALLSSSTRTRMPKRPRDTEQESPFATPCASMNSNNNIAFSSSPRTKRQRLATAPEQQSTIQSTDFHGYQCQKWDTRFQELLEFKQTHGHCDVPNIFPSNTRLAQWVKRQRYQHKLKTQGKRNTLTDARQQALEMIGFVWDSHEAAWMERWNELRSFWRENGHSNVPTNYEENRQLWIWVKCQRRQHRLYESGRPSNMTMERIIKMESLNFDWNPRKLNLY